MPGRAWFGGNTDVVRQPKKPEPKAKAEESDNDESGIDSEDGRTEIALEYKGAKGTVKIGRGGSMLLWALAWAVAVLSTLIGLTMLVSLLDKIGVIGCTLSILIFLVSQASAFLHR